MIRLGIAGIGTIARDYIGLIAAGCVKDVELTALCSRSDVSLHRLQTQYSLSAKVFQDNYVQNVTQLPCKIGTGQSLQALLKPITDSLVQMGIGKRVINHESCLVYFHKK